MNPTSRTASSSTRPGASPLPRQQTFNSNTRVLDTVSGRILCVADLRGRLSNVNDLAREVNAKAVVHTGDFGFFESGSLGRINDRTLRHLIMYSPLIPNAQRQSLLAPENPPGAIRQAMNISLLSEFPLLLSGQIKLNVPVYTVWGACEDVFILEKFRQGVYDIENLHLLDEATTHCLDVGGVKLRLLGLGGALVPHKMFDNGEGNATIAGAQGTMWTTALQIGELVDTAQRAFEQSETRLLVTHASPGREGIISQLALVLKADLTLSAGLHFRYTSSWNEFSVQGDFDGFRHKIIAGKEGFDKIWDSVKQQVETVIDENQRIFLEKALSVVEKVPPSQTHLGAGGTATGEEPAWKNCWNWNLCDAAYGSLILDIKEGRVSAEIKSQGFNYAYRRAATPTTTTTQNAGAPSNHVSTLASTPAKQSVPSTPALGNQQQRADVNSGRETPRDAASPKPNGSLTGSPLDKGDKDKFKRDKKKDKKFGKDKDDEKTDDGSVADHKVEAGAAASGKATPVHTDGDPRSNTMSPAGADSPGARTPTLKRPPRNPWTIFMRYSTVVDEQEMRDFFGDAKAGILRIHFNPHYGKPVRSAFIEFGDEEAMKAGLFGHQEKLKDTAPITLAQAEDRESHPPGGIRGGGRGGRGRGSGFAARGLAMAGLTRQHSEKRQSAGDVSEPVKVESESK